MTKLACLAGLDLDDEGLFAVTCDRPRNPRGPHTRHRHYLSERSLIEWSDSAPGASRDNPALGSAWGRPQHR